MRTPSAMPVTTTTATITMPPVQSSFFRGVAARPFSVRITAGGTRGPGRIVRRTPRLVGVSASVIVRSIVVMVVVATMGVLLASAAVTMARAPLRVGRRGATACPAVPPRNCARRRDTTPVFFAVKLKGFVVRGQQCVGCLR